jgi:hypothetical protein
MTQEQKVIRAKVGLLELAKQRGNVSQPCKCWATAATASIGSRSSRTKAASFGVAGDQPQEASVKNAPEIEAAVVELRSRSRLGCTYPTS